MTQLFPIKNYEEKYSITKDGRIWSNYNNKWMKISTICGNEFITLYMNGIRYKFKIRYLLETQFPNEIFYLTEKDGIKLYPIDKYEGKYSITKCGKIYSHLTNGWKTNSIGKRGYYYTGLTKEGHLLNKTISRMLAQTFISNPENKSDVNHKDGNKLNDSLNNLEWTTHQENIIHAIDTGLLKHTKRAKIHSKYKGVYWDNRRNHWTANIIIKGKNHYLGSFKNEENAYNKILVFKSKLYSCT